MPRMYRFIRGSWLAERAGTYISFVRMPFAQSLMEKFFFSQFHSPGQQIVNFNL